MNKEKIGLGIITYNRQEFFTQCYNSIDKTKIDELVVVNDGTPYTNVNIDCSIIQHSVNKGVGVSKNDAMKHLMSKNCKYIFLIEDDIIIKNNNVFQAYIDAYNITGIKHMMYGYHGPANKQNHIPSPRLIVEYKNGVKISLNQHCVGAFCFYTKEVLDKVGYNDEVFVNAWEHVEHSYRIVKEGYLPGYWWWPDITNSNEYLDEIACSEVSSTIRPQNNWQFNIQKGAQHFIKKHKLSPVQIPDTDVQTIQTNLRKIYKNR